MSNNRGSQMNKSIDISNAVLTPNLIHPNFYKTTHYTSRCNYSSKSLQRSKPLTEHEKEQRKQWEKRQIVILSQIQSNAVLAGNKHEKN